MFGETGCEKIQSRAACIPLQLHIAEDTKSFYDVHICSFFDDMNSFEEDHKDGLRVAALVYMCRLVRTVGRGGAKKNCHYAQYCCNTIGIIYPSQKINSVMIVLLMAVTYATIKIFLMRLFLSGSM
jgi:hypothetical protein